LAGTEAAARGDELEIVHDEKGKAFVALEAAGLCADLEDAGGTCGIDPKRGGGDLGQGFGPAAPGFAGWMGGAELVRVDLSDGRNEALEQRLLGHFQAEDGDGLLRADGDVFGEVEGESGFSL